MLIHQMIAAIGDEAAAQRDEGPDRRVSGNKELAEAAGKTDRRGCRRNEAWNEQITAKDWPLSPGKVQNGV